jgi:hypothetical protein
MSTIKAFSAAFPTAIDLSVSPPISYVNIRDICGGAYSSGATCIVGIGEQPYLDNPITILGWSLTYSGLIKLPNTYQGGKLGKLYAGPIFRPVLTSTLGNGVPYLPYMQAPLPPDATLIQEVWDGSTDPVFPQAELSATGVINYQALSSSMTLPQPIELNSGDQVAFGMWLTPSLAASLILYIINAAFTIQYTDKT